MKTKGGRGEPVAENLDESSIDDAVIGRYPIRTDFKFRRIAERKVFLPPMCEVSPYQSITYSGEESEGEAARKKATPIQELTDIAMAEVREYARAIKSDRRFTLCPFRVFSRPCRVRDHLCMYREKENNWCASGTNQRRVCKAPYDNDKMKAKKSASGFLFRPSANYIRMSAEIIRSDVKQRTPLRCMDLDASTQANSILRLVQFRNGKSYMFVDEARDGAGKFRRVGYGYYAEGFYNNVARFARGELTKCRCI